MTTCKLCDKEFDEDDTIALYYGDVVHNDCAARWLEMRGTIEQQVDRAMLQHLIGEWDAR